MRNEKLIGKRGNGSEWWRDEWEKKRKRRMTWEMRKKMREKRKKQKQKQRKDNVTEMRSGQLKEH